MIASHLTSRSEGMNWSNDIARLWQFDNAKVSVQFDKAKVSLQMKLP